MHTSNPEATYNRSQNNINVVVYCTYKENSYCSNSVNNEHNLPHSLPNTLKCLFENLKKYVICKIVTLIRSTNTLKILNQSITTTSRHTVVYRAAQEA